jgi:hypothetical protein
MGIRRLPLAVKVIVRALVTTAALVVVGLALQMLLYAVSQPPAGAGSPSTCRESSRPRSRSHWRWASSSKRRE